MKNQPNPCSATDELALLEFDGDALQCNHGLPVDHADLTPKRQRALALYATIKELRNALTVQRGGDI